MPESAGSEFSDYIGQTTSKGTLVVERAPITNFARAVGDGSAVYRNADAARAAGFVDVPAPPTFCFSIQNWGKWEERQPRSDPNARSPMAEVMGGLMATGGIVLHGEQTFEYHRPMVAGDVLTYKGQVTDLYRKASGDKTMTFLIIEDTYTDESGQPVLTSTMNLLHRG